jgi:hypothetical protein
MSEGGFEMRIRNRWTAGLVVVAGLALAACQPKVAAPAKVKPATVERVEGSDLARVRLTERAAQRLDIQTSGVREVATARSGRRMVVPYAAVLYDARGDTWVYTNPEALVYVRSAIRVDYIDGDQAVLSGGPPVGTQVVTVGGQELFGAEFEIGH